MIPTLYETTEQSFTTNGLGKLPDFLTGKVKEGRNGQFILTGEYAATGKNADQLTEQRILTVVPADGKAEQPFRICSVTKKTGGKYEVTANHISYDLNGIVVMPFTATSVADALQKISTNAVGNCPFTFWTDKEVTGPFTLKSPKTVREILGGSQGSLLDVYGTGEYEFDGFTVRLYLHRGNDNGVVIRAGKNLTSASAEISTDGVYTAIVPFWQNEHTIVTLPEKIVESGHAGGIQQTKVVDFSSEWETAPTEAQLRARAQAYLAANSGWELKENIKVSFIPLWQTEEYKDYAASIERVNLCDTVTVLHEALGITAEAKVLETTYNFLKDRYDSIEIGNAKRTDLSDVIRDSAEQTVTQAVDEGGVIQAAVQKATDLLTGVTGGYVKFNYNGDGQPYEMLIMDAEQEGDATNIWRFNAAGWGFSRNGGASYTTAATLDGGITADFITAGTLTGLRINNGFGTFEVDSSGTVTANSLTSNNATITGGSININSSSETTDYITLNSAKSRSTFQPNGVYVNNLAEAANPNRRAAINGAAITLTNTSNSNSLVAISGTSTYGTVMAYDSNGVKRTTLDGSGFIEVFDSSGRRRFMASATGNVIVYDAAGVVRAEVLSSGAVNLYGSGGKDLAKLGVGSDYGWLYLYDNNGTRRVRLGDTGLYFYNSSGTLTKTYSAT